MVFPHAVFLSQYSMEYLVRARPRHLLVPDKDDALGDLVAGDLSLAVTGYFFSGCTHSFMEHYHAGATGFLMLKGKPYTR